MKMMVDSFCYMIGCAGFFILGVFFGILLMVLMKEQDEERKNEHDSEGIDQH